MVIKAPVVLAAGGTGGHLFPAVALGDELTRRGYDVHMLTDRRARRFLDSFAEDHIHVIGSATISGKNPLKLLRSLWQMMGGVMQSRRLLRRLKPCLVAGFGGYPTVPPLFAATAMGIPAFIHEQNAVMGRANRFLAPRVCAIAGGFLEPAGRFAGKMIVTGNPLRQAVIDAAQRPYKPATGNEPFSLLIFGGSQGASFFSEIMPQALALLAPSVRARLAITQQARPADLACLQQAYASLGLKADIGPFFSDMAARIAAAHYIIARSGASTVAEIAAIGRPALMVPYPHALDHDQIQNAPALARGVACVVVRQPVLTLERLP